MKIQNMGTYLVWTLLVGVAFLSVEAIPAHAQPFGATSSSTALGGLSHWILMQQATFYRELAGAVRAAKADGNAAIGLLSVSFLYGIFHAAGPGHGKAVISSYMFANDETWRRGIILSFASSLLQAVVAVVIVGIMALLLGATGKMIGDAVRMIEIVSYALIAAVGARLLWVKGRAFLRSLRPQSSPAHHHHSANDHALCGHHHHHDEHASAWSHAHGPELQELAGPKGWQRGLSAAVAVGLRPCSGAIIVLVFALAQGIFLTGVGATLVMGLGTAITVAAIATVAVMARGLAGRFAQAESGRGLVVLRGFETLAAALVLLFGLLLLTGYLASERLVGM